MHAYSVFGQWVTGSVCRKENEVFEKENPLLYTAVIVIDRKTQYCMVLHCVYGS